MAGVSTESLKKVETALTANTAVSPDHLAQELFDIADVIDNDGSLRRGLVDPARSEEARAGIVKSVLGGKVSEAAVNVVSTAAAARWSHERDLADALETSAVSALAISAEQRGGVEALETVINELLTFVNSVNGSAEAQSALTDDRATDEAKKKLALVLAGNPDSAEGRILVERASSNPRGTTPARLAESFVETIVERQHRSIARVETATPLTEAQIEKLRAGLSKAYGKELKLDITVEPELIGGLRVQVGDEMMDGSVQTRLNELNRSFN